MGNFDNPGEDEGDSPYTDPEDSEAVAKAKKTAIETGEYTYTERDVILYNLGIGATEKELEWVFENHDNFHPLPSFGVVPQFPTSSGLPLDFLPNFNPVGLVFVLGWHCIVFMNVTSLYRLNYYMVNNISRSKSRFLRAGRL